MITKRSSRIIDAARYLAELSQADGIPLSGMRLHSLLLAAAIQGVVYDVLITHQSDAAITGCTGLDGTHYGVRFLAIPVPPSSEHIVQPEEISPAYPYRLDTIQRAIILHTWRNSHDVSDWILADALWNAEVFDLLRPEVLRREREGETTPAVVSLEDIIVYRYASGRDYIPIEGLGFYLAKNLPGASGYTLHNLAYLLIRRGLAAGIRFRAPEDSRGIAQHSHGVVVDGLGIPVTDAPVTYSMIMHEKPKKRARAETLYDDSRGKKARFLDTWLSKFSQLQEWEIATVVRNDSFLATKPPHPQGFSLDEVLQYSAERILLDPDGKAF